MDNAHEMIPKYISDNNIMIGSYDDMMDTVLRMIKQKHFFNMDKNIVERMYGRFDIYVLSW